MSTVPIYLLDANVFIEAKNRYYAFDIVPAFWGSLVTHGTNGRIRSIDKIRDELKAGKDELAEWAEDASRDIIFVNSGESDVIEAYKEVMTWVQGNAQFTEAARAEFAGDPDGWLIAYAKSKGPNYIVVTHEDNRPEARAKVLIPVVCIHFGIRWLDTFEMLRELGVRFNA